MASQSSPTSQNAGGGKAGDVRQYSNAAQFPVAPSFSIGEIVYVYLNNQAQPDGPLVVIAIEEGNMYRLKWQSNGAEYFCLVSENLLYRPGYPRLAAFLSSDPGLCSFKQFRRLHARVLLSKQDAIVELQEQLDDLDSQEPTAYFLHTLRQDRNTSRRALLSNISEQLTEYNTLLQSFYWHLERKRPRESQLQSISNWLEGNKPMVEAESSAYLDWEDLGSPHNPSDHGGLESVLERYSVRLQKTRVGGIFRTERDLEKSTDKHVFHFSSDRVATISRFITAICAVSTLTVPIAVLYTITSMEWRLGVVTAFTVVFAASLCMTQTRNFEIFSATAAYCAVMVVFVANLPA
ncbi:hypothetical protein P154DRAFT_619088 [Amniculicola lignicola CBS 123094]|uniref:DUF6594 domain-containing protein n=1 Tax=Amniculicola lignicola CBS 123094 TaxID=1392246 RepID=A0A6A5WVS4_9PLEO|nr:hypothetical protein P154DRAFT_619088 [Amniculicola lignicola CBS 123094]